MLRRMLDAGISGINGTAKPLGWYACVQENRSLSEPLRMDRTDAWKKTSHSVQWITSEPAMQKCQVQRRDYKSSSQQVCDRVASHDVLGRAHLREEEQHNDADHPQDAGHSQTHPAGRLLVVYAQRCGARQQQSVDDMVYICQNTALYA